MPLIQLNHAPAPDPHEDGMSVNLSRGASDMPDQSPAFGLDMLGDLSEIMAPAADTGMENFSENLANKIDAAWLVKKGHEIVDRVATNIAARKGWLDRYERGLMMMGLLEGEIDDGPFPGASTAVLPLITEAQIHFWAGALPELFPSEGPARAKVEGQQNQDMIERASRVADYQNYEMTVLDRPAYFEFSRLFWALPAIGCGYKKIFFDKTLGHSVSSYVSAHDLIMPPHAANLTTAPYFTHRFYRTPNELRRSIISGMYRDVGLSSPLGRDSDEARAITEEVTDNDGAPTVGSDDEAAAEYELYEHYTEEDIPGFEDRDEDGEPTGLALPYIFTVEQESGRVLSVYRDWKSSDQKLKRRRRHVVRYDFLPGPGAYPLGLFHIAGPLQEAATGALRVLIDGSATASLQGGFVGKEGQMKAERLTIEPGVWKPVEVLSEDLQKAFVTPPFKEPSASLTQGLTFVVDVFRRLAATADLSVGDTDANTPVGTTLALLEKAHRMPSAIHQGLFASLSEELEIRFELAQENVPDEGYVYERDGKGVTLFAQDFGDGVKIVPVADPNIFSTTQRVQLAQAVLQAADSHPQLLSQKKSMKRYLSALKVPDVDDLMTIDDDAPEAMDPVSETQAILRGKPVRAYPDQQHMAHIQVHMAFLQHPGFGGHPDVAAQVGPAVHAHIGEHLGYLFGQYARQAGVPAPMLDPKTGKPMSYPGDNPVSPDQLAQMAAQLVPQFAQMQGLPPAPHPPAPPDPAAAMQAKTQATVQAIQATTQAKIAAVQQETTAKVQRDDALHQFGQLQTSQAHELALTHKAQAHVVDQDEREHKAQTDRVDRELDVQKQAIGVQIEDQFLKQGVQNAENKLMIDRATAHHDMQVDAAKTAQDLRHREVGAQIDQMDRAHALAHDNAQREAKTQEAKTRSRLSRKKPPASDAG